MRGVRLLGSPTFLLRCLKVLLSSFSVHRCLATVVPFGADSVDGSHVVPPTLFVPCGAMSDETSAVVPSARRSLEVRNQHDISSLTLSSHVEERCVPLGAAVIHGVGKSSLSIFAHELEQDKLELTTVGHGLNKSALVVTSPPTASCPHDAQYELRPCGDIVVLKHTRWSATRLCLQEKKHALYSVRQKHYIHNVFSVSKSLTCYMTLLWP